MKITQISSEQSLEHKPNCVPERRIRWLALQRYSITARGNCSSWESKSWENPLENKASGEEDNTRKLSPCVWSTVSLTSTWMSMDQVVETMLISVTWLHVLKFSLLLPSFCPQLKAGQCLRRICVLLCRWSQQWVFYFSHMVLFFYPKFTLSWELFNTWQRCELSFVNQSCICQQVLFIFYTELPSLPPPGKTWNNSLQLFTITRLSRSGLSHQAADSSLTNGIIEPKVNFICFAWLWRDKAADNPGNLHKTSVIFVTGMRNHNINISLFLSTSISVTAITIQWMKNLKKHEWQGVMYNVTICNGIKSSHSYKYCDNWQTVAAVNTVD